MDRKFNDLQISEQEENESNPESGPDSPPSSLVNDFKMASTFSPKRSKRGAHKKVISVPIKDLDGARMKGENAPPPSDSWAWRKYGQKPIKGSPYPRGYYRCSSSKGCPARKQVERSRVDPTKLVISYSCEHNHPWPPPSRSHHHQASVPKPPTTTVASPKPQISESKPETPEPEAGKSFTDLGDESLITTDEFTWFGDMEATSWTIISSHIFSEERSSADTEFSPMREEDESLFADLGELPECSSVFRHQRGVGPQVQIC
ncbi:hypothetical protein K2173_005416 [Erythroxylum novogranatense]|uniref:WRKY domain-containing protein n=1 Tax=Erythroxylum novogranatense TaxID=1862640 RepID=A0AAV8T6B8_9ROSI|nr:hypothetical protein K2173_005416 [Erythroxylum novogranatense]